MTFTFTEALFCGLLYWFVWNEWIFGSLLADASCVGFVLGVFFGDIETGLIVGCSIGMLYIANWAVGANAPSDGVLAACIAVPLAIKSGLTTEAAVAISIPFSLIGVFLDNGRRLVNGMWNRSIRKKIGEKKYDTLWVDALVGPSAVNFVFRCVPVTALLFIFGGAAGDAVAAFPEWLNNGLALVGAMLPGLGLMLCVIFIGKKELLPYFFVGYYISYFTGISYVFLCVIGVIVAVLHTQFVSEMFEDDDDDDDWDEDEEDEDEETEKAAVSPYGPDHAFSSRLEVFAFCCKFLFFYRISQCIEYFYGTGFAWSYKKPLARIYDVNSDEYQAAMQRAAEPFITHPWWGICLNTAPLAMEEDIAVNGDPDGSKGAAITTLKTSLMGPFAGLGDGFDAGLTQPLLKSLCYTVGLQGNPLGACYGLFLWIWEMIPTAISGIIGYESGRSGLMDLISSGNFQRVLYGAGILGLMMMGGMAATYCTVPLTITWETLAGTSDLVSILNGFIPGMLPLAFLMIAYVSLNKGVKFTNLIIGTCVFGIVMGLLGFC